MALPELASGRTAPQRLVVVGSSTADPAVVLRTLLGDPLVSRTAALDAVITVIDGPTASVRAATDQPLGGDGLGAHRLLLADRLVLGRATLLSETGLDAVAWGLREMNRFARICVPALDGIRPEVLVDVGTHRADAVAARLRSHRPFRPSGGDLAQALVRVEGRLDPDGLEEWCHDLVHTHAPRLLRVEGAFCLRGTPSRAVLLGSGSTTVFRLLTDRDDAEERLESRVLLVAGDIEHDRLVSALAATALP
jgi:G3E family GTPase